MGDGPLTVGVLGGAGGGGCEVGDGLDAADGIGEDDDDGFGGAGLGAEEVGFGLADSAEVEDDLDFGLDEAVSLEEEELDIVLDDHVGFG